MATPTNANPLRTVAQKQMLARVDEMQKAFSDAATVAINTVPEIIFTTYFLPLFSGETKKDAADLLSRWYVIAGTSYSPVNVVDAKGNIVIQVPPIQNNKHFKPGNSRENPLAYIVKVATEKGSISPNAGINILNNGFTNKLVKMESEGDDTEVLAAWDKLFKHYGKSPNSSAKPIATTVEYEDEFGFN